MASLTTALTHPDDLVMAFLEPFLDQRARHRLLDVCPRDASFRRKWFVHSARLLLPSKRLVAQRLTASHTAQSLLQNATVEDAALLDELKNFAALTHVAVTGTLDSTKHENSPPTSRPLRPAPAGLRPPSGNDAVILPRTLPRSIQSLDLMHATLNDVSALALLPSLTQLKLRKLHTSADQEIVSRVLAQLVQLTELTLWEPAMLEFAFLSGMQRLRSLTIAGTWSVVDLELLRGLSNLSYLELKLCHVTNVGALAGTEAAPLPLKTLSLMGVTVINRPPDATGLVTQNELLAGLEDSSDTFDDVLAAVNKCNQLTTLIMGGIQTFDLSALQSMKSLTSLSLRMTDDMEWEPLLDLPNLAILDQQGDCDNPTDQWEILVELPALRELRHPVYLDEEDPPLPLVEELIVHSTNDMTAPKLKHWPRLTSINWRGQCDTDLVRRLPVNLRHLQLDLEHDIDFKRLKRLTCLESLRLNCTRLRFLYRRGESESVQEEDYSFLSALHDLKKLELDGEPFRDLGLLWSLQKLTYLDVSRTLVDDVTPLHDLRALEFVDLMDTRVPDEAVRRLGYHRSLLRVRHPDGSERLSPFAEDDIAPPQVLPPLSCSLSWHAS
jgi:hypothetical protein